MKKLESALVALVLAESIGLAGTREVPAPYVRVDHQSVRGSVPRFSPPPAASPKSIVACTSLSSVAFHGQAVPGGGTLSPSAFFNSATLSSTGTVAFYSQVNGSPRNQGIFTAGPQGLQAVAMGGGPGGGSGQSGGGVGDPTPIGGTFSGFFGGTFFTPAINRRGDVLFLADVENGSASRALFLYRAIPQTIVKVAAIGDPAPGGSFTAIGPGSMNSFGTVAFLARTGGGTNSNAYLWKNGVVTKIAAIGDPAPLGGTFTLIGTESLGFTDGTQIPGGPLPDVNDAEKITFRAIASGGPVSRGIIVSQSGVHQWAVKAGDAAPQGGTFFDMQAAMINEAGEIAFFADIMTGPGQFNSGWYAGLPGQLRRALAFFDPLDDAAICFGLAFSRNPLTPLDEQGNLVVWTDAQLPGGAMEERLIVCSRDGNVTTAARKGEATPLGGTLGALDAWPSMNDQAKLEVGAGTPGASALNARFVVSDVLTWFDVGFAKTGVAGKPTLEGEGKLVAGTPGQLVLSGAAPNAAAFLFIGFAQANLPLLGGTLVPSPSLSPFVFTTNAAGGIAIPWAAWPAVVPPCLDLWFQFWIADPAASSGASASNGLEATPQ